MREQKVLDVMTHEVVTVPQETPFTELVRLMHERRVGGVPVVDGGGKLVGIVTEADLLIAEEDPVEPSGRSRSLLEWFVHPRRLAATHARAADLRARDVMTPEVVTATSDMRLHEAVRLLLDAGVKRLPVIDRDGRIVGIVSRRDLLAPFLRPADDIRREIVREIVLRTMWLDPSTIGVEVNQGVVALTGQVDRKSTKEILAELVRRVDGVVGVKDDVHYEQDDREVPMAPPHREIAWEENWVRRE